MGSGCSLFGRAAWCGALLHSPRSHLSSSHDCTHATPAPAGPLLYHWQNAVAAADASAEGVVAGVDERYLRSVELPYADVRYAVLASGFDIAAEDVARSSYAANPRGLMRNIYTLIHFTAVKR